MSVSENARRTVTRQPVSTGVRLPVMRRAQLREQPWDVIGVVALGGAIGAVARFGIGRAWPTPAGTFPWATLGINVSGCALIGVLMVLITELWTPHRLVRPFAGTGILGGFTTFSTYAVDIQRLLAVGAPRTGLAYLVVTPVTALAAVTVTVVLTRRAIRRVPPRRAIRRVPR